MRPWYWFQWYGKRERGAWPIVRFRPEAAVMPLHNRSADGQSDTHAAALRGVEGIEELVHALTVNADAAVPHHHAHAVAILSLGSD
jgi:hypothetical protein